MRIHIFLYLFSMFTQITSDDVLVLQPFGSQSHRHFVLPISNRLGERGHQVTFVSTYSYGDSVPPNVTEISYPQFINNFNALQDITMNLMKYGWHPDILSQYYKYHSQICKEFFDSGLIQNWISKGKKFRIVMIDAAMHECILPIWTHVGESLIIVNTGVLNPWVREAMSVHTPYSYVPFMTLPHSDHMSFLQRCRNSLFWIMAKVLQPMIANTYYENVVLRYFPGTKPESETMKNISLVLVNHDPVLTPPNPTLPTIIDIGGIQCRSALPLENGKLKSFVDSADENGFVLFSFGSVINGNLINEKLTKLFIDAFAQVKQRVVWKYETQLQHLPNNVMTVDWIPQQDLLGHPKIRAFINHGGLQSLQEGIYHGVPQICFPMTTDQPSLVAVTSGHGIVIKMNIHSVTVEELVQAINKATQDNEMYKAVQHYSDILRYRPNPLDTAIYWIEYVMRYRGAHHLKTAAADLNFFTYYLLDVLALVILVLVLIVSLVWFSIRKLIKSYCLWVIDIIKNMSFKLKTS